MIELLRKRRSIRKFTTEKIAPKTIETIVEAALLAPSSRGYKPWEFVVVDNPETLAILSGAKVHGSEFLKDAPLAIVVCADSTKSDVWIEDCSITSIIIQLTAFSLGLGSCWVQIRNRPHDGEQTAEAYVKEQLGIPNHIHVESILAIGHPAEKKSPLAKDALQFEKIRNNRW